MQHISQSWRLIERIKEANNILYLHDGLNIKSINEINNFSQYLHKLLYSNEENDFESRAFKPIQLTL